MIGEKKVHDFIRDFHQSLTNDQVFTIPEVQKFVKEKGCDRDENSVYQNVRVCTTNAKARLNDENAWVKHGDGRDLFFQISKKEYRKYLLGQDPNPFYFEEKKLDEEPIDHQEDADELPNKLMTELLDPRDGAWPDLGGVYLFCANHSVQYAGETSNVNQRLTQYKQEKNFVQLMCDRVEFIFIEDESTRKLVESVLIKYVRPAYNKRGVKE